VIGLSKALRIIASVLVFGAVAYVLYDIIGSRVSGRESRLKRLISAAYSRLRKKIVVD